MPGQTTFDKVIVMAVAALLGAFALSVAGPVISQAGANDISGKRDDDLREIEVKDDDDDEGDSANRSRGSGGSKGSGKGDRLEVRTGRSRRDSNTHSRNGSVQHEHPGYQDTVTWTRNSR